MFGYLRIDKAELKVREYEAYKAVYCGLCKQLGRDYSVISRAVLSYDCTFYAVLLMSLNRGCKGFRDGRCVCNPLKKCKFAECSDQSYSKAAALSIISVYYKLHDDLLDSGFFRRLPIYFILPLFSRSHKKAARLYPELETLVAEMMRMQRDAESGSETSIDEAAHPTALMLSKILCAEGADEPQKAVLSELGYQLGRWVYLMDAADDYYKDRRNGCFNPFLKYEKEEAVNRMEDALSVSLGRAFDAYSLLELTDFKGITENLLRFGLPLQQSRVVSKLTEVTDDKSL